MSARHTLIATALASLLMVDCPARAAAPAPAEPTEFLLLGEVHDNAAQHQLRARLIQSLLSDGRPTAVVFEQIPAHRNAAIAARRLEPQALDAEALVDLSQLDRKNWRWPLHKPLIEASLQGSAAIAGGNLSREELRPLMAGLSERWPAALRELVQKTPWSEAEQAALLKAIDEGHCGALPAAMHEPMALAQRARDARMALSMLEAASAGARRVVLIAGNGHVDRGLGVPRYLLAAGIAPEALRSIGYLERGNEGKGQFDDQVLTEPQTREDPCAAFAKPKR